MVKPNIEECNLIERVEGVVCEYFNINPQSLVNSDRTSNVTLARGIVIYILHVDFNVSISKIAHTYFRTVRSIFWHVNKIKYLVKNQKNYIKMYEDICSELNK